MAAVTGRSADVINLIRSITDSRQHGTSASET